jgi:osmotically inducible lipoprotein OsmB
MRKTILIVATLAGLSALPVSAHAQNAVGGAIVGAGAGAVIGGAVTGRPPMPNRATVRGCAGTTIGAAAIAAGVAKRMA